MPILILSLAPSTRPGAAFEGFPKTFRAAPRVAPTAAAPFMKSLRFTASSSRDMSPTFRVAHPKRPVYPESRRYAVVLSEDHKEWWVRDCKRFSAAEHASLLTH